MKKLVVIALILVSMSGFSQKIKLSEGSLLPLKGATVIKTEFVYDQMLIGKDGLSEQEYLTKKKSDYDKKEPGRGDRFERKWFEDRKNLFAPNFNELFEKFGKVSTVGDSKYTLIFATTRTEPGWNVGVMRANAYIDAVITIVETANPSTVIAKITLFKSPGRTMTGADYDSGARIQEAYAKAGKEIGKFIYGETH